MPLLVGAAVAPFASPYGLSLIGYYRQLLANPLLRAFVNEWRASTPSIRTVAFYLVALATIWLLGRNGRHVTWFERLTLLFTLCAGAAAIRSIVWFGLAALVLLPSLLQPTLRGLDFAHFRRFARPLAFCAALTIAATAAYAGTRPADWFTSRWPVAQSGQIETLAEHSPNGRVFADDRYADWLLWNYPQLRGRVAYDVRFELFDARSFLRLESFRDRIGDGWRSAAAGYDLIVADPTQQHEVESGLLADRFTTAVQAPKLVVLTRQDPIRSARSITAARLAPSALGHEHAGNLSTEALAHK